MKTIWIYEMIMRLSYRFMTKSKAKRVAKNDSFTTFIKNMRIVGSVYAKLYKPDPFFGVINKMNAPAIAYKNYVANDFGDCDDFASLCYYWGTEYNPILFTYFATDVRRAHTVTLFRHGGKIWCVDWSRSDCFDSWDAVIEHFENLYNIRIVSVHPAIMDYNKGRFVSVKFDDVVKGLI